MDNEAERRELDAKRLKDAWLKKFGAYSTDRADLAEKYGVNTSFIGNLINGYKPINATWKLRMAEALEMPVTQIWPDFDLSSEILAELPPHLSRLFNEALALDPASVDVLTSVAAQMKPKKT